MKSEKYSLEKAEEYAKAEQEQKEAELTPEQIERIMDKVQDINAEGTAFTSRSDQYLRELFQEGIRSSGRADDRDKFQAKEEWARTIKIDNKAVVYFNIVGRSRTGTLRSRRDKGKIVENIAESYWVNPGNVVVTFDLSKFNEVLEDPATPDAIIGSRRSLKGRQFIPEYEKDNSTTVIIDKKTGEILSNNPSAREIMGLLERGYSREDLIISPHDEFGFILKHRIPPRFFKGIVAIPDKDGNLNVENLVKIMTEIYGGNPEMMLPIYNPQGDLQWPKLVTHNEVRKFISEREVGRKNE